MSGRRVTPAGTGPRTRCNSSPLMSSTSSFVLSRTLQAAAEKSRVPIPSCPLGSLGFPRCRGPSSSLSSLSFSSSSPSSFSARLRRLRRCNAPAKPRQSFSDSAAALSPSGPSQSPAGPPASFCASPRLLVSPGSRLPSASPSPPPAGAAVEDALLLPSTSTASAALPAVSWTPVPPRPRPRPRPLPRARDAWASEPRLAVSPPRCPRPPPFVRAPRVAPAAPSPRVLGPGKPDTGQLVGGQQRTASSNTHLAQSHRRPCAGRRRGWHPTRRERARHESRRLPRAPSQRPRTPPQRSGFAGTARPRGRASAPASALSTASAPAGGGTAGDASTECATKSAGTRHRARRRIAAAFRRLCMVADPLQLPSLCRQSCLS